MREGGKRNETNSRLVELERELTRWRIAMSIYGHLCRQFLAAVEIQNYAEMKKLVKLGVDPDCLDEDSGNRAITLAASVDDSVSVEIIANAGANVNARNNDGSTALTWAQSGPVAEFLLRRGATVYAEEPDDGMLSLHIAASEGRCGVLSLILQSPSGRAAIDRFDALERTPLACAVESSQYEAVKLRKRLMNREVSATVLDKPCYPERGRLWRREMHRKPRDVR